MTIKSIPLHKREASAKTRQFDGPLFHSSLDPVFEGVPILAKNVQRPASALSVKSRPSSARPQEVLVHRLGGRSANLKGKNIRLIPINNPLQFIGVPDMQATLKYGDVRPGTSHGGRKLPPIKGILTNPDPESTTTHKPVRHVAFDALTGTVENTRMALISRPFSAK
jgi:hypothetical protein